mgnify:FL=1|jgi:hypothetical protein|tara:strand:- start:217 stop:744 length:528 start_codon:yes stop_codon:yes gene_type:complete
MASAITKIAELNGTNSSSVISFTSISSTYKDLMFFGSLRNFASGTSYSNQEVKINFNGDTGTNYWDAYSYQRDNTIRYQMYTSSDRLRPIVCTTSSGSTTAYGTFRLFCPGYRDASLYKRFDILGAAHQTSNGMQNTIQSNSGWDQYAAITQVDFTNTLANTFTTDSRISLYGIK